MLSRLRRTLQGFTLVRPIRHFSNCPSLKMPTSKLINTPTPSNALIGGVPTIHYLDFLSRGRGQVVRLFFEDAGIAYSDVRYSSAEWPAAKKSVFIEGGLNPTGNLPVIELGGEGGEVLTQSYPTLRYLAGMLGGMMGWMLGSGIGLIG